MRRLSAILFLLLLTAAFAVAGVSPTTFSPKPSGDGGGSIVTTAWVAERIDDPRLVLFQVGERKEYDSLHLPKAQFFSTRDVAKPYVEGAIPLELPDPAALDSTLEARGISDSSIIVVYPGKDWFTPSARIFLTLTWFGLGDRVHIMDGGMPAWIRDGHPTTAETSATAPAKGNVTAHIRGDIVVPKTWVSSRLNDPKVDILDARNSKFYTGEDTGSSRPGHIAGAHSLPFVSLVDSTGHFISTDSMKTLYAAAGMAAGKTAVSYCHIGQQASLVWLMARVCGYEARMYDGSMDEWTKDPEAPMATGTEPGGTGGK